MAKNTYGTGCFTLMNIGEKATASENGLLTTIAWEQGGKLGYALEGSIFVAGSVVQWLRDGLRMLGRASDSHDYAERAKDNDGVYLVPTFTGIGGALLAERRARRGLWPVARDQQGAFHPCCVESIAYQSADVLKAMQADAEIDMRELRADGGAIANNFLAQFQADMLGVNLLRPKINETTALGAAYMAGWQSDSGIHA